MELLRCLARRSRPQSETWWVRANVGKQAPLLRNLFYRFRTREIRDLACRREGNYVGALYEQVPIRAHRFPTISNDTPPDSSVTVLPSN